MIIIQEGGTGFERNEEESGQQQQQLMAEEDICEIEAGEGVVIEELQEHLESVEGVFLDEEDAAAGNGGGV